MYLTGLTHPAIRPITRHAILAALLIAGAAQAQNADVPMPRPGLWQVSVSQDNAASESYKECLDEGTLKKARELQETMAKTMDCGLKASKQGAGWLQTSNCKIGPDGKRQQSTRKISGDFSTRYLIEESASQKAPDGQVLKASIKSEGKHLGACPADMEPGDRILPNGQKINPFKMQPAAPAQ